MREASYQDKYNELLLFTIWMMAVCMGFICSLVSQSIKIQPHDLVVLGVKPRFVKCRRLKSNERLKISTNIRNTLQHYPINYYLLSDLEIPD